MAEKPQSQEGEMLTLTEVANRTGISMPTLQRYKKNYQDRIPSQGKGRSQRYPVAALEVFEEIKKENIGKRGRPKKDSSDTGRKKKPAAKSRKTKSSRQGRKRAAQTEGDDGKKLLTLTEIGKRTGISYPTLSRYVKKYGSEIESEGSGRSRRFHPEAVETFKRLRSQSRRGRAPGTKKSSSGSAQSSRGTGGGGKLERDVVKRLSAIEKQLKAIEKKLSKPVQLTLRRQ